MASVNWTNQKAPTRKYFTELPLGATFSIDSPHARGAVYMKVYDQHESEYKMLELATGKIFPVNTNPVKEISVEINIATAKPSIY